MEEKELTQLEKNIKSLEREGLTIKHNPSPLITNIGGHDYFQLKDIDFKNSTVAFYIGAFNNKDSDGDIIMPGSYKKTIRENSKRFKHLIDHDRTKAPGAVREVNEDDHGPYMVSKLAPTQLGKDTLIEYEYQIITEHSQGFITTKQYPDKGRNANIITEVMLMEGSSLHAWGANPETPFIGSMKGETLIDLLKKMDVLLHNSDISDERAQELQDQFNILNEKVLGLKKAGEPEPFDYSKLVNLVN